MNPESDYSRYYIRLANYYDRFVLSLFFIYSLVVLFSYRDTVTAVFLTGIFLSWFIIALFHKKINENIRVYKIKTLLIFVILSFIVSFFHIHTQRNAGVEYFYFSILFTVPFVFNYKEDYFLILLTIGITVINFIGSAFWKLDFLSEKYHQSPDDFTMVRVANIVFFFVKFLMDMYFVFQKDRLIYGLIMETETQEHTIDILEKENNSMKNECFEEIIKLAKSNSPEFLTRFREVYPDLVAVLLDINPKFRISELTLCAYIFLGFTTKDIAAYTFTSINTVKVRKYNLRKKLNIPAEMNTEMWFKHLQG